MLFAAIRLQAEWNNGIVEDWVWKAEKGILQKMLNLHFMMMPDRHPFSAFVPKNTPLLRENQYNYIRFDSLNPPFHYPKNHNSNIPSLHHSLRGVGATLRAGGQL